MDRLDNITRLTYDFRLAGQPVTLPTAKDMFYVRPLQRPDTWGRVIGSVSFSVPQNILTAWDAQILRTGTTGLSFLVPFIIRGGVARWTNGDYTAVPAYEVFFTTQRPDSTAGDPAARINTETGGGPRLVMAPNRALSFMAAANGMRRAAAVLTTGSVFNRLPTNFAYAQHQYVYSFWFQIERTTSAAFNVTGRQAGPETDVAYPSRPSTLVVSRYAYSGLSWGSVTREESSFGVLNTAYVCLAAPPFAEFRLLSISIQEI